MSGPRSISKSLLINAADRFRRLGPPSVRAWAQFRHLQKASGNAFAAAVPRKVRIIVVASLRNPGIAVSLASTAALTFSPVVGIARLADLAHLGSEIQESRRSP